MDVSAVIVNWNTRDLLARCVRSLLGTPGEVALEVIVVDNASPDDSCEMLRREFPEVRLIANARNVGFTRAANQGIAVSRGRYLLVLNADTEAVGDAVGVMVRFMDAHPEVAALGPRFVNTDGSLQPSCFSDVGPLKSFAVASGLHDVLPYAQLARLNPAGWLRRLVDFPDHDRVQHPDWFRGACMCLRADPVRQVDAFDEDFFVYYEEIDLFYRLRAHGWKVVCIPDATFIHDGAVTLDLAHERMTLTFWRSCLHFHRKHAGPMWRHRAAILLGTLVRLVDTLVRASFGDRSARERFCTSAVVVAWLLDDPSEQSR